MMSSSSLTKNNVANAVGGKTARACDNCITKRARWYCAADDAFLCQSCDSSVHSANSLARRHERVRLKTASFKSTTTETIPVPSWHHGFTKKARTTRHHGKHSTTTTPKSSSNEAANKNVNVNDKVNVNVNPFHLVPEVGFDEVNSHSQSHEENEAQLLYRVPIYDPFIAELYNSPCSVTSTEVENKSKKVHQNHHEMEMEMENFHGLLPSDIELAEFAADVETLLGSGMENECIGMEELGLMKEEEEWVNSEKVKVEEEVVEGYEIEMGKESSFELNFDYETCEEVKELGDQKENNENMGKRKISLQLNYEEVIIAWDGQKCPWTNGHKPNFEAHEACWPEFMGSCRMEIQYPYGGIGYHHTVMGDGGREARVSRYREKRRTRLFSKKIRYEVRKLNAEKRPRLKGRFVKRTSFAAPPTFPLLK